MITPALTLNFTGAVLDSRITFSRVGATATLVNSTGLVESVAADTPRFDYDQITLACKGLLIEEQRTNLLQRSDDFANAYWSKLDSTISSNAITAPDGTLTADKFIPNSGVNLASILNRVRRVETKAASAITYTASVFAKRGELDRIRILCFGVNVGDGFARVTYSLVDGAVVSAAESYGTFSNASSTIQAFKDDWYRVTLTFTSNATTSLDWNYDALDSVKTTRARGDRE